jgi:hypothetical protein
VEAKGPKPILLVSLMVVVVMVMMMMMVKKEVREIWETRKEMKAPEKRS